MTARSGRPARDRNSGEAPRAFIPIVVTARASRAEIGPVAAGRLRVRVTAAPSDGQANEAVLRALARELGVPLRDLAIVGGLTARRKLVAVAGLSQDAVARTFPDLDHERGSRIAGYDAATPPAHAGDPSPGD